MENVSAPSRSRVRTQKGSAILEAGLVIMPLMAVGFALVDYPVAFFVQNVLRNAVREGIRFAVTQQTGANGQDAAIKTVVQNNSMGFLTSTSYVSISYLNGQTLQSVSGVGSNAQGNICIVSIINYPWNWMVPIWRNSSAFTFSASSSDVMESPPNGVLPSR